MRIETQHAGGPTPEPKGKEERVAHVSKEFEAVFVRELLNECHALGTHKAQGYGSMAVDALAQAIVDGGGLGFARQIEAGLSQDKSTQDSGKPAVMKP